MPNSNGIQKQIGPKAAYERVMDTLMDATKRAERNGIGIDDFLPALLDFAAGVALAMDGEQCLHAAVSRMSRRIEDYRNGTFPVNASEFELAYASFQKVVQPLLRNGAHA